MSLSINQAFFQNLSNQALSDTALIHTLPIELLWKIFSYLLPDDLGRCGLVSKQWQMLANDEFLWKAMCPAIAFGAKQWKEFFDVEVEEPPLPPSIFKTILSPCPLQQAKKKRDEANLLKRLWRAVYPNTIEERKKVKDTHVFVLVPGSIKGQPLTIASLGKHMKTKLPELQGWGSGYRVLAAVTKDCEKNNQSCWVLMTKSALWGSENKSFDIQQKLVAHLGQGNYQVPRAIDVATCFFAEYARSRERLLNDEEGDDVLYTRCKENSKGSQIIVGAFTINGFIVTVPYDNNSIKNIGIAALRKF